MTRKYHNEVSEYDKEMPKILSVIKMKRHDDRPLTQPKALWID